MTLEERIAEVIAGDEDDDSQVGQTLRRNAQWQAAAVVGVLRQGPTVEVWVEDSAYIGVNTQDAHKYIVDGLGLGGGGTLAVVLLDEEN